MKIVTKTATQARNEFFDLIAAARHAGQVTLVIKNGKPTARIVPETVQKVDWQKYHRVVAKAGGIFTKKDAEHIRQSRIDSRKNKYPEW